MVQCLDNLVSSVRMRLNAQGFKEGFGLSPEPAELSVAQHVFVFVLFVRERAAREIELPCDAVDDLHRCLKRLFNWFCRVWICLSARVQFTPSRLMLFLLFLGGGNQPGKEVPSSVPHLVCFGIRRDGISGGKPSASSTA